MKARGERRKSKGTKNRNYVLGQFIALELDSFRLSVTMDLKKEKQNDIDSKTMKLGFVDSGQLVDVEKIDREK